MTTIKKSRAEKQSKGFLKGEALRKNTTNMPTDLGSRSERCDLFMGVYYMFLFCFVLFFKTRKGAILEIVY